MAKYTETLAEFLTDHTLPTVFNQIQHFDAIFLARYGNREIGFETEDLFAIKLELYANLYIPEFASRIAKIESAKSNLLNPNIKITHTHTLGEQDSAQWILPSNEITGDGQPSAKSHADQTINKDEETHFGLTAEQNIQLLEILHNETETETELLLAKFKPLFMQVF